MRLKDVDATWVFPPRNDTFVTLRQSQPFHPVGIGHETASEEDEMYQMSIDAIDPVKGHVPGNMRIVCRFLNPTNFDKTKKRHDEDDGVSIWTKDLYKEWSGASINRM